MDYGPRTAQVQAFIGSLLNLSKEEWDGSVTAMVRSGLDLYDGPNAVHFASMEAASSHGLWGEMSIAQVATRDAVASLGWAVNDEETLANFAHIAVAAVVVLNIVPIRILAPAFVPFRFTAVVLPEE